MIYFKFNSQISGLDFTKIFNVFGGVLKFEKNSLGWEVVNSVLVEAHLQSSYSMLLSGLARKECANLKRMKSCFKEPLEIYQIANWRIINSSYILVGNSSN